MSKIEAERKMVVMKKVTALLLALIMLVALVGCGKKEKTVIKLTLSTQDSEAILAAAGIRLPDAQNAPGANSTVKWFGETDPFQNYDEGEMVNTGYFTFEEKYGGKVEWIETTWNTKMDDLANLVISGVSPDVTSAGHGVSATFPMSCIKGTFLPVDDYIDYTNPLWADMQDASTYFAMGGKHYAIVYDLEMQNVCLYNRRILNDWGFDDPADLYANDEWTWDKFYQMCIEFTDQDENRFGLDGYAFPGGIVESTGQQMIQKREDGTFYSNIDSPEIERAEQLLTDIVKNELCYSRGGWGVRSTNGIKDGLTLFYIIGPGFFTGPVEDVSSEWGDITAGDLMFVPTPRDPQGDGVYYLCSNPCGYMLVNGGENHVGAALLASCIRFKILDPTVVDIDRKQLEEKYLWTQEMLEMWDTCYALASAHPIIYYYGDTLKNLDDAVGNLSNGIPFNKASSSWAQLKEQYRETIEYYIEELNATISDFKPEG